MNNDYDRGESPRYTMTNFNKDISPIDISDPVPTFGIFARCNFRRNKTLITKEWGDCY